MQTGQVSVTHLSREMKWADARTSRSALHAQPCCIGVIIQLPPLMLTTGTLHCPPCQGFL